MTELARAISLAVLNEARIKRNLSNIINLDKKSFKIANIAMKIKKEELRRINLLNDIKRIKQVCA